MASLRRLAAQKGYAPRDPAFDRTFLNIVKRDGRIFELELLARYNLLHPLNLLRQAREGLTMAQRGKLAYLPHRIEGRSQVQAIFRRWQNEHGAQGS